MTTDVQQANSRSLFKMNTDFWQQARGPPIGNPQVGNLLVNTSTPPNIVSSGNPVTSSSSASSGAGGNRSGNNNDGSNTTNGAGGGNVGGGGDGTGGSGGGPSSASPVPNMQNTSNNTGNANSILTQSALHHQLQQIHQQQQHQNNQAANTTGINTPIPAGHLTPNQLTPGGGPASVVGLQQMQQQLQQQHQQHNHPNQNQQLSLQGQSHPPQSLTPGGSSTPDIKFNNEKFVNEIQLQLSRSNSAAAISERTLEECWSTLQRLFMHKSAMQQIQHIPRVGLGPGMGAEVKPHQCQQCLKSFSSNHQLVQHIRVHTGEKPYKCSYCDRRFKQLSHVQQHTRLHTGERPYKCHLPDCGRAFIQLSNLQQHLRNHDAQVERAKNRPFHCNICGKGFATESSLRTHTSKELQLHLGVLQQHAALIGGPNATTCPICHKLFLGGEALMEHMKHTHKDPNASGVATKRRTANHPCPVCGKHYVNEGSLRKHLACHPETSQLTTSLRMWPCSVCQAVFTHEAGLLTHMEHMRMDPKHQFAAQYVLSRAAAERRERDTLLAAAVAVSASSSGLLSMGGGGGAGDGGTNSMCASPSAHSDSSSGNGRLSSTGSDPGTNLLNNNNNNCSSKLSDILRAGNNGHLHQQYGVDDIHANRMSLMAAAAGIVGQTGAGVPGSLGSPGVGVDSTTAGAVQAAVVNLAAAAMRMGHVAPQQSVNNGPSASGPSASPPMGNDSASAAAAHAAMNAMRVSMADSMMRSSMVVDPMSHQSHHQHHQQNSPEAALRRHQAEVILRSQAEAAIRLAVSVAASNNGASNDVNVNNPLRHHNGSFGQQQQQQNSGNGSGNGASQNNSNNGQQSQQHPPQSQTPQLQQQQQQQQKRQNEYANFMKIT